jgi:hypothetical protein
MARWIGIDLGIARCTTLKAHGLKYIQVKPQGMKATASQ